MYPAFRSNRSALGFCLLIIALLLLPIFLSWLGPPSREQAYKGIPVRYGVPGHEVDVIYDNKKNADVLFLGSSLVLTAIFPGPLEQALSAHIGRPAHVAVLGMTWQGLDLQYYMLRDYLQTHKASVIVLNEPQAGLTTNEPHIEAFRWIRYGEANSDFEGIPFVRKVQIYGHMVLGAPRELASRLRPNIIDQQETTVAALDEYLKSRRDNGYHGSTFIPDKVDSTSGNPQAQLLPMNSPLIAKRGPNPGPYPMHFLRMILDLAKQNNCELVFMHIPTDAEYGMNTLPEVTDWARDNSANYQMIGLPGASLFPGMSKQRFLHFYVDNHFNRNGSSLFTDAITPAVIKAYDQSTNKF